MTTRFTFPIIKYNTFRKHPFTPLTFIWMKTDQDFRLFFVHHIIPESNHIYICHVLLDNNWPFNIQINCMTNLVFNVITITYIFILHTLNITRELPAHARNQWETCLVAGPFVLEGRYIESCTHHCNINFYQFCLRNVTILNNIS